MNAKVCDCKCCPSCGASDELGALAERLRGLPLETLQLIDKLVQRSTQLSQDARSVGALDSWAGNPGVTGPKRSWRVSYEPFSGSWEIVIQAESIRVLRGKTPEDARAQGAMAVQS